MENEPLHEANIGELNAEQSYERPEVPLNPEDELSKELPEAEEWLSSQVASVSRYRAIVEEARLYGEPIPASYRQTEPVPSAIAPEVARQAQQRLGLWDKYDLMSDETGDLVDIRDEAITSAENLDFSIIQFSTKHDWPFRAWLDAMHDKFKNVAAADIEEFLGTYPKEYEYRALHIRNIIADNAPELLTPDLKTIVDPTQPVWRSCSAYAAILLRNKNSGDLDAYAVKSLPTALPVGSRSEYLPEDELTAKPVDSMTSDELALYVEPDNVAAVEARGSALYQELNAEAREALLVRRLFDVVTKSRDPLLIQGSAERNRALEGGPILQEGDLVHTTRSPELLEQILADGLRCSEAVVDNRSRVINFPFTVSFLKVDEALAANQSVEEQFASLKNAAYGNINIVLHRDQDSTDFDTEQQNRSGIQRQIFGGVPSTEIKSIVIRNHDGVDETVEKVIESIKRHGMFIPVYDQAGKILFSSQDT